MGFGLKAGRPRGEADESGAHLWRLASEKGSLLRWGHQAHSSPHCVLHCPDEVPSFSSVLAFFLGDGCAPAPHYSDPDPSVESTSAPIRSWRPFLHWRGAQGLVNMTSDPLRTSGLKVCACFPPQGSPHNCGGLFLSHIPLAQPGTHLLGCSPQAIRISRSVIHFPSQVAGPGFKEQTAGSVSIPTAATAGFLSSNSAFVPLLQSFHLGNLVSAP